MADASALDLLDVLNRSAGSELGAGPADRRSLCDREPQFLAQELEAGVVVAPLPAGVPDAAYVSDSAGSFVEESAEDWFSAAAKTFAADEELGQADRVLPFAGDPALGGEVSELEGAGGHADAAGAEGHHDIRHVRVSELDGGSSGLERCDQRAGVKCVIDS